MTLDRMINIQRLNILLKLPRVNVAKLDEAGWNTLLDDLYFVVFGQKNRLERLKKAREQFYDSDTFHDSVTAVGVRAAQEGLRGQLLHLQHGRSDGEPIMEFQLAEQRAVVAWRKGGFSHSYFSRDLPTMIYSTLVFLLDLTHLRPDDLFICANPQCSLIHIPLRKPHKGKRSYCGGGKGCARVLASRRYRKKKKAEVQATERKRNIKRYGEKLAKQLPGQKIKRGVRRKV